MVGDERKKERKGSLYLTADKAGDLDVGKICKSTRYIPEVYEPRSIPESREGPLFMQ